ncbi:MAG TPA: hydroxyacid dehydrogenase [bacterium]|nr:hydroxyacid dehydrogenase [bacterium]HNT66446.1 hydroxyacid dehydrogenase [bacterium]
MMKILFSDAFDPSLPGKLSRFGEVTDDKSQLADAEVILIRSKTKVTKELIDQAPKLRLVIRGGVGLDNVDVETAKTKGIQVYNTAEASSVAVAELAFAMMIALPNHLVEAHQSMSEGKWLKKELKRTELYGKTLGLIGCGRIGKEVAKRAAAFEMRVLGYDAVSVESPHIKMVKELADLLPQCDYLSLHLPLNPSTLGLIDKKRIAQMKNGVYLINTGRGKTVVEEDLAEALKSGKIAGYATDVWYSDPPENTPLRGAPNTLMAPHIGASTTENLLRIGEIVEKLIEKFVAEK